MKANNKRHKEKKTQTGATALNQIKSVFVGKKKIKTEGKNFSIQFQLQSKSKLLFGKIKSLLAPSRSQSKDKFLAKIKKRLQKINALTQSKAKQTPLVKKADKTVVAGSFHERHPKIILFLKIIFFPIINPFVRYGLIVVFLIALAVLIYILQDLPSPKRLTSKENFAVSTQIFDRNGTLLYEIFAEENRTPISIEDLPAHVYQAAIAIEDKNFYKHLGFDLEGIARAVKSNMQGKRLEGGSTITQQLVKNALLTPERSVKRKIKEAILAIFTELLYSKEQILEMYLNYIPYGGTAVGIEAAAKQYFDKHAKDLTLEEAALLAGLPQAPSRFSPFGSDPEQAKIRQSDVLRRMAEDGYVTYLEAEKAKSAVLNYALSKTDIRAPHFVFYVRDLLYEKYGVETVEKGGLRVTTTLDLELQNTAQASLSAEIDKIGKRYRLSNGAAMVTKPNTGEILAMIGSRDYFDTANDGQVNVTLAQRQPGSSIKPIMYATTFQEKTLNPGSILLDVPTCFQIPSQKPYCPKNYDGTFKGAVPVRLALGNSLNIPAVKSLKTIGVIKFIEQATKMGITTWTDTSRYGLSLTLGGGEVRMIDMAQAFSVLSNKGVKVALTPILKIEDFRGKLIEELDIGERIEHLNYLNTYDDDRSKDGVQRVMDQAPAYMISHIMQDNKARTAAFGPNSKLVIPGQVVSAKTGTTNNMKDNWTIGFTPEFLTIVWVGNNDNTPMSRIASGVTGAAPIWNNIMSFVLKDQEPIWQEKPSDVGSAHVCVNGMPPQLSDVKCTPKNEELYWKKGKPSKSQMIKKEIWIDPTTGLPPPPGETPDGLVLEERWIYQDPVTSDYCSDCNRQTNEEGQPLYEKQVVGE
ncbi:MAG: PBP1A family penicillin-binding protein [Candidatus Woesebacteria bacterium]|jgi:1A family penicillin-binding protein